MWRVASGVLALMLLVMVALQSAEHVTVAWERLTFKLFPSAELAMTYGQRHFSSRSSAAYNISHAKYFFEQALTLNPRYPYLYHEVARVAFLEGKFQKALQSINLQIENQGLDTPNSYYVRGLIKGFMGDYAGSARDYEVYLETDPTNWAAINDYAWVLLKAGRVEDALLATTFGLSKFPRNPWLLNSNAIALHELGFKGPAREQAIRALKEVQLLSEEEWLRAYPGNDPKIAEAGVLAFKDALIGNVHSILLEAKKTELQ
jgi:tetratricopeptide (TPR) repeat protein